MLKFTIRQWMLLTLLIGATIEFGPVLDRQFLWMRLRAEHARCLRANDALREVIGCGTFVPYDPDESLYFPNGMWEDRSKLVRELEQMTDKARSLEGTVKGYQQWKDNPFAAKKRKLQSKRAFGERPPM